MLEKKPPHTLPHSTCARCRINAEANAVNIGCFLVLFALFMSALMVVGIWRIFT